VEINIDEATVQAALDSQATAGIKAAFEGYSVRSTIEKAIAESVVPAMIANAIEKAASSIDIDNLQKHLAEEMARSVTRGVQAVIRDTMVEVILSIQKVPEYDKEARKAAKEKILATVF